MKHRKTVDLSLTPSPEEAANIEDFFPASVWEQVTQHLTAGYDSERAKMSRDPWHSDRVAACHVFVAGYIAGVRNERQRRK